MFDIERYYMFLWSIIERYTSFKYNLSSKNASQKVKEIAKDNAFKETKLKIKTPSKSKVSSSSDKREVSWHSQPIDYYYQIRCNSVHRGKAISKEYDLLLEAYIHMVKLFNSVLKEYMLDKNYVKQIGSNSELTAYRELTDTFDDKFDKSIFSKKQIRIDHCF